MAAPAKAVLIAIIGALGLLMMTQLAFFFPFYMTIVVETFNLANVAANDNYIKYMYYDSSYEGLKERPIFKANRDRVKIEAFPTKDGSFKTKAIGIPGEDGTDFWYDKAGWPDYAKPYGQRGDRITVRVSAVYPIKVKLFKKEYKRLIPVSFSITCVGLKYYKDLPYHNLFE